MVVRRSHYISSSEWASVTAQAYLPAGYLEACGAPARRIGVPADKVTGDLVEEGRV